jgi:hypothetical protein
MEKNKVGQQKINNEKEAQDENDRRGEEKEETRE